MKRALAALAGLLFAVPLLLATPAQAATTGGSGGALTDRTFQSFTANSITSNYHVYAAGLDWSKPVGILMYADGSGGYGFDNPTQSYSLGGTNGVIAKAKANNLLLVVPNAPAPSCDNADNCWYNSSGTPSAASKAGWASALMTTVKGQYNIDLDRVAIGGYSSGAQWATRWFMPLYGEAQSVDLAVAISFGGAPAVTGSFSAAYKAATVISFDTGTADTGIDGAYGTASYQSVGGYNWYTSNGFQTDATWVSGEDHSRDGQFGGILDREIVQWLPAGGGGTTPPPTQNWVTSVQPTATGGTFNLNIPTGSPTTTVRVSSDNWVNYKYLNTTGTGAQSLTFTTLDPATTYQYKVESGSTSNIVATGSFTTSAAPVAYDHQIVPSSTGATLTVDIPAGSPRLTWRMSSSPITSQTGFYDYTDTKGDNVVVNTSSTLLRGTTYYYQLESGTRSNVVASGTFKTLP